MKLRISFFSDPSGANALPLPLAYGNAEFDSVERAREIAVADATRPGAYAHSIIIESVDGGTISERWVRDGDHWKSTDAYGAIIAWIALLIIVPIRIVMV